MNSICKNHPSPSVGISLAFSRSPNLPTGNHFFTTTVERHASHTLRRAREFGPRGFFAVGEEEGHFEQAIFGHVELADGDRLRRIIEPNVSAHHVGKQLLVLAA